MQVVKAPFLTQKVPGKLRDIIIGQNFIIALKEDKPCGRKAPEGFSAESPLQSRLMLSVLPERK